MRAIHPQDPATTFAAVLDALPIVAWMANPDGVVTYLSRGWEQMTGNSASEVLEQGYHVVIHPADLARTAATWDAARAAESSYRDEVRIRQADGSYHSMLSQAEPMWGHGGGIIGWFGTLTDIRDRKRAEAALAESESTFRALSATIPGVTWAASPAGELTFVGDRWTSLHGKPREDALGESWLESVHPDDRERVLGVWARSLSSGEPYEVEFRVRIVDGTYRWFLVRALPVRDEQDCIVSWVGVNVDIDDQHVAYERAHRIAVTFQDASLPKTLPIIENLRLSADYRPGNTESTIGGDWYDAFLLPDGRVALTIGDVLGSGLAAAVIMGKVRQSMRSAAVLSPDPESMLDVADRTIRDESDDTYATALAAIYDPRVGQFSIASAGHAGPVLRHADGRIEEFA
ncbi:MAG TPA: PAS domain-containing protein, partial [Candidatus Elarobacter sp.]|nr:PAS domain-containing protein [Candidatus Elarobacter sp.]